MADPHTTSNHSFLDIGRHMVYSFSCVVALPESNVGIIDHYFFENGVVLGNAAIEVLFLDEVDSDGPRPVEFTHSRYLLHNLFLSQRFPDAEDKSHREVRVFLLDLFGSFIEKVSEGRIRHFSYEISIFVVVLEFDKE